MIRHKCEIRVRYPETDAMGFVYHANYFHWFEVARIEMLDAIGCPYKSLEAQGMYLPVFEVGAKYFSPARFDERITITATISQLPKVKIHIDYEAHEGERKCATGFTKHAFIDAEGYAIKPSTQFLDSVSKAFNSHSE